MMKECDTVHLKKIELRGFKSFPSKTEIEFKDGLTAIVGPNGSGKSNITDAVRWVLGEQSVKSLRGEKLEDVIFAGSDSKAKMNFCEVSLTLDNSDRGINIDLDEVEIKRRIYRTGDSQFSLNSKQCRLKDIKEILMDTGLGRDSYAIIEQGKVDDILSNNPQNKRKIFDEACGIARYRFKKNETEKNLTNVSENLERINDIYFEIEKQVEPLRRQSEKAKSYLKVSDRLKKLEVNHILREVDRTNENLKSYVDEYRMLNENLEKISNEKNEVSISLDEISTDIENIALTNKSLSKEIQSIKEFLIRCESDEKLITERKKNSISDIEKLEKAIEDARIRTLDLADLQSTIEHENNQKKDLLETNREEIEKIVEDIENEQAKLGDIENSISSLQAQKEKNKSKINELLREKEVLSANISNLESKLDETRNDGSEDLELISRLKDDHENIMQKLSFSNEKLETKQKDLSVLDKEIKSLGDNIIKTKSEIEKETIHLNDIISKINIYTNIENQMEGYFKGVKEVIKNKNLKGVRGALAQLIKTDKIYEKAIEAAAGSSMQNIVVDDEVCAKEAIEYLRKNKLGRVTFLPISKIRSKKTDFSYAKKLSGSIGIASDLIKTEDEYKNIVNMVLGTTLIVDNMDNAIAISKDKNIRLRLVTLQGDVINTSGSMTGGSLKSSSNLLSRSRIIEQFKDQEKESRVRLDDMLSNLEGLDEKKSRIEINIEQLQNDIVNLEKDIYRYNTDISSIENSLQNFDQEIEKRHEGIKNINSLRDDYLQKQKDILEQVKELDDKLKVDDTEDLRLKKDLIMLKSHLAVLSERLNELRINQAKQEEIYSSGEKEEERIEWEKLELISNIKKQEAQLDELKASIEAYDNEHNNIAKKKTEDEGRLSSLIDRQINSENKYKASNEMLKSLESKLRTIEKTEYELKEKEFISRTKIERTENSKKLFIETLSDKYEMSVLLANEIRDDSLEIDNDELSSLKKEIRKIGNVNLDSIEEYDKISERYKLYTEQKYDLEKSKAALDTMLTELETEMRREFIDNFDKISENYSKVYETLFGGGKGELILEDRDDVLNSDILIHGRPPGKNMKSLNLLSGGERAMTAICILFAILISKPTPFVILDEIEAPLDDVNVFRFASFVKNLTDRTQFIAVTHRRGTMESADYIYGITMQEKGISKVLSLDLNEAKNII